MTLLEQIQQLVGQLTPSEQHCLLEYLAPKVVHSSESINRSMDGNAWADFFQIGDEISASDTPDSVTLTIALSAMRR
ncbi:hypothetical protein AB3R30_00845 [Leptolyngbyaceae cyanobacterium UHCC 1019]